MLISPVLFQIANSKNGVHIVGIVSDDIGEYK